MAKKAQGEMKVFTTSDFIFHTFFSSCFLYKRKIFVWFKKICTILNIKQIYITFFQNIFTLLETKNIVLF